MARVLPALLVCLLAAGAAQARGPVGPAVATRASRLVGHRSLHDLTARYPDDCSGLVRFVYQASAGIELLPPATPGGGSSAAAAMYRRLRRTHAVRRRTARKGDLVFFRDTYPGGRGITHVGIVESVERDGRVTFVHRTSTGIVRSRLDPRHPFVRRDRDREVRNDVLRRATAATRAYTAGELLVGFAAPRSPARAG